LVATELRPVFPDNLVLGG